MITEQRVNKNDVRPAGLDGRCFYCGRSVGNLHIRDCVARTRTIVLRINDTFELVSTTPESWTMEETAFGMQEGDDQFIWEWLCDTYGDDCPGGKSWGAAIEVVREATEVDVATLPFWEEAGIPAG